MRRIEVAGPKTLDLPAARRFGTLYRMASSDLIQAQSAAAEAALVDYLNDLVARSYAIVYGRGRRRSRLLWQFVAMGFPRLFRQEVGAFLLAASIFVAGGATGAVWTAVDPDAAPVMLPEQHRNLTPRERVREERKTRGQHGLGESAAFGSFLFTHNIQVSFFEYALGLTAGIGTVALAFYNGVPLGSLAVQYHRDRQGLFFWAWILPHGIPELTSVFISGAAGLLLARAMIAPGRRRRRDALLAAAKRATLLVLGTIPILIVAGIVEGTISQMHPPRIAFGVKLAFAVVLGVATYAYLFFAGRGPAVGGEDHNSLLALSSK